MLLGFVLAVATAGPPPPVVDPATAAPRPSGSAQRTLTLTVTWCERLVLAVDPGGEPRVDGAGLVSVDDVASDRRQPAPTGGRARPALETLAPR